MSASGTEGDVDDVDRTTVSVSADELRGLLETVELLSGFTLLHVQNDCIWFEFTDDAGVMYVRSPTIGCDAEGDITVHVSADQLRTALDDLYYAAVELQIGDEDSGIRVTDGPFTESAKIVSTETFMRPNWPKFIREAEVIATADAWRFVGAVRKVAPPADTPVRFKAGQDRILIEGADSDEIGGKWPYFDDVIAAFHARPEANSESVIEFTPNVLADAVSPIPLEGGQDIEVRWSPDFPISMQASDGTFVSLAPRIADDNDSDGGDDGE